LLLSIDMIITTRGIVLKFTKYRETSIITNIFTEQVGLSSFIVNNVRSAKSKFKPGYFEPLSLVELTAYHHQERDINRLSEIKSLHPLHSLRQNIYKSSIIVFLAEILNKVIIEKDQNLPLFNFVFNALRDFDQVAENNNFHLQFLLQLTSHLGFSVRNHEDFVNESNNQRFYQEPQHLNLLKSLERTAFNSHITIDTQTRAIILNDIIFYYQQHLGIRKLKSLEVLSTIFR
jgi:DNA repair protein RecO (recombination protein O)